MALFQPSEAELRRRTGPDTEIVARDDLLLSIGPLAQHPWSSTVHWTRWGETEVEKRISEVLDLFRTRRHAFVWLVTDDSTPASLSDRLSSRGLIQELEGKMLTAALPLEGLRSNSEVRVEEVIDEERMVDALRVDHPAWDDERLRPYVEDRMRRLGTDWHAAVAYLGDQPVGTARWFIHRDLSAVEFTGAETVPAYRRRGIYSTLVAYRADLAARQGCALAGIIADVRTSAPILMKRGFKDLGRATFFLWPTSDGAQRGRVQAGLASGAR